ncbi:MAG TPA: hypothetical protein VF837_00030 [Patescibacteria group bacterium]
MKIKSLIPILIFAVLLAGCAKKTSTSGTTPTPAGAGTKILVNELPMDQRPFVALVPHETGKLFTFYAENADKASAATLDLEYQSGDLLKGARSTLTPPISNPYTKAIILGSCSTGGKCTFDSDLKSGTMKFSLNFTGVAATNVLKGDFTFITGQNNLPDGKFTFAPAKSKIPNNIIMGNSFGIPKSAGKDIYLYPVVLTSASDKNITGTLTIADTSVTSIEIYDGQSYQPLKFTKKDNSLVINLDQKPWSKSATITRDDIKGTQETVNLNVVGPIVLFK